MRTSLLLPLFGLAFAACSSTSPQQSTEEVKKDWLDPNPILAAEIESRIESIPYRHGEELLNHLMWIVERGELAAGLTLDGLYHENPKVRSNCAWVLGQMGQRGILPNSHAMMPHLESLLTDENEAVRLEVASTLIALGDFAGAPTLIEGLDSENPRARFLCSKSLERATKHEVEFDHLATDPSERAPAIAVWRRWWAKQSNDPFFHDQYAQAHGLPTLAEQEGETTGEQAADPALVPAAPMGDVTPAENESGSPIEGVETATDPTGSGEQTTTGNEGGENPPAQPTGTGEVTPPTGGVETTGTGEPGTGEPGTGGAETPTAGAEQPAGTPTEKPASPFDWLRRKN